MKYIKLFESFNLIREYVENSIIKLKNYLTQSEEDKKKKLPYLVLYPDIFETFLLDNPDIDVSIEDFEIDGVLMDGYDMIYHLEDTYPKVYKAYADYLYDKIMNRKLGIDMFDYPSWYFMSYDSLVKNQWLIHFTNYPFNLKRKGFLRGVSDIEKLGLTTLLPDEHFTNDGSGFKFGYLLDDYMKYGRVENIYDETIEDFKYGKYAILFRASGIRVWHKTDEEHQVIFKADTANNIIVIEQLRQYKWSIVSKKGLQGKTTNILYENKSLKNVIEWAIKNYPQYRNEI